MSPLSNLIVCKFMFLNNLFSIVYNGFTNPVRPRSNANHYSPLQSGRLPERLRHDAFWYVW